MKCVCLFYFCLQCLLPWDLDCRKSEWSKRASGTFLSSQILEMGDGGTSSSPAAQAGGGIAQEICHFTDAGCCTKGSGLAGAFFTASREVNKSPLAVWDAWGIWWSLLLCNLISEGLCLEQSEKLSQRGIFISYLTDLHCGILLQMIL